MDDSRTDESRKRVRHPGVRLAIGFPIVFAAFLAVVGLPALLPDALWATALAAVVQVGVVYGVYYLVIARWLERRRSLTELPLRSPGGLVLGLVVGSVLTAAVLGLLALLGTVEVTQTANPGMITVAAALISAAQVAFVEELVFRGALFRLVQEWAGTWIGIAASAVVFGLLHLLNPDATLWGAIAVAIEAGVTLAALYVLTGNLWAAIGAHLAWNLWQLLLGLPVSGNEPGTGLVMTSLTGPEWLTGGAFGYEASVVTVALWLVVGIAALWRARMLGRFVPLRREPEGIEPQAT